MAKKNEKDKGKDAYSVLMSSLGLDDSAGSSKPAASSSKPAASSSKPASTKSKDKGSTTAYDALMTSLSQSGISKSKASRKDKWDAFWESIGKNAKAGATNSTVMNQQHYWSKNDPTAEKYVERRLSGMNTDVDMDRGLNENYVTERFLKNVFDPNNMVGQERGQGSRMYTQEDADKAIAKADTYWEKQ